MFTIPFRLSHRDQAKSEFAELSIEQARTTGLAKLTQIAWFDARPRKLSRRRSFQFIIVASSHPKPRRSFSHVTSVASSFHRYQCRGRSPINPALASLCLANDEIHIGMIGCGGRAGEHMSVLEKLPGVKVSACATPIQNAWLMRRSVFPMRAPTPICVNCWTTRASTRCSSRPVIIGIAWLRFGPCRPVRMFTSRNRYRTANGKASKPSLPLVSTIAFARWHTAAIRSDAGGDQEVLARGQGPRPTPDRARQSLRDPSIDGKRDKALEIDSNVAYDLWLGPAQKRPIYRDKLQYDWHWDWNTGSGEMGNWGVHVLDDLRNNVFRDSVTLPKRIFGGGGRVAWKDAGETPNVHFVYFDTGSIPVVIGLTNLPSAPQGNKVPNRPGPESATSSIAKAVVLKVNAVAARPMTRTAN